MHRPHIGSHLHDAHYWHFARTSGLPRGYFDQQHNRGDYAVFIFCIGVLAGIATGIIWQWVS